MNIYIQLTPAPIPLPLPSRFPNDGICGSEIEFQGKVRASEKETIIPGLLYEAYDAMARKEIERLLREISNSGPCLSVEVIHRLGWVPVGEVSLYVRVRSIHRREGFQLLTQFLDRMKQDVPIWKVVPDTQ
jgi:molybdopterin synthase catalytic subunit